MISYFLYFTFVQYIAGSAYIKVDLKNKTQVEIFNKYVQAVCLNREALCRNVSASILCTMRKNNQTNKMEYKEFDDSCRLFMYNFCDFPGQEYYIVTRGTCESYLGSRRSENNPTEEDTADQGSTDAPGNPDTEGNPDNDTQPVDATTLASVYIPKTNKLALRKKQFTKTTKKRYGIDSAEDGHPCPYYCPNTYDPMCMNVNAGAGLYFNYKIFINHCQLDMYYCKYFDNTEKFPMPPDEDDFGVQSSKLSFSACADVRYMQFARFSEAASSLGHYGWLPDPQRASHIMRPGERRPGYG